jgi:hypothetical protein
VLVEQDGIYGALHTVSKDGALMHLDRGADGTVHGLPVWGYDFPPGRVAIQTLQQPWAPAWMAGLIDDKPVPFEETAAETDARQLQAAAVAAVVSRPLAWASPRPTSAAARSTSWRNGCASRRRRTRMEDLGTMTVRYAANEPNLANTSEGASAQAGLPLTFQSRNRAIVFAKPHPNRERFLRAFARASATRQPARHGDRACGTSPSGATGRSSSATRR